MTDRTAELQAKLQSLREQLLGPWEQLSAAFFERMAQQVGYGEAKRIFAETVKQQRPKPGPKRPPPRKRTGRHNPSRDMNLLAAWEQCKARLGNNKTEFARVLLGANQGLPREYWTGSSVPQIVRRLNRLLHAELTSGKLLEEYLSRNFGSNNRAK